MKLFNVSNLKVLHDYKSKPLINNPLNLIETSWAGKLTKSSFNQVCLICGTSENIEMHHIRSVKDVRARYIKGGKVSFARFEGAIKRKQFPLCSYHHQLYHKGILTYQELKSIAGHR